MPDRISCSGARVQPPGYHLVTHRGRRSMGTLDGKIALVTGGARGIGRAIALRFAREGADVAVADQNVGGARSVAGEIEATGRRALAIGVDVRDLAQIRAMVDQVVGTFGRIDVL